MSAPALKAGVSPTWYVVACHTKQERMARFHLERQGFTVYLPMTLGGLVRGRQSIVAFLPGYLFVQVEDDSAWWAIRSTIGVKSVIAGGSTGKPLPMRDELLAEIRKREVDGLVTVRRDFKPGERVRIGLLPVEALFEEVSGERRVSLVVSLLGRDSRVKVDPLSLR